MAPSLKRLASTDRDISPPAKRRVPATATAQTVANFFKPASDKVMEPKIVQFRILHDSVLTAKYEAVDPKPTIKPHPRKIAAFDFDDTIIATASGNRFSKDAQDWQWWHASVPGKLQQLHDDGFDIVIISNQAGIKLHPDPKTAKGDMKSLTKFKGKVTAVMTRLALPIHLFAATLHDLNRKPRDGMWRLMLDALGCKDDEIDRERSVFVGDAAGRAADKAQGKRADHSCSDRDLATNINIPFSTPEEYFLDQAVRPFVRALEPSDYLSSSTEVKPALSFSKKHDVEIVLFCGSPGSGKSTFYWTYLQPLGCERANQDILKTREKCMIAVTNAIQDGKSAAIDNTNADRATRGAWIALAQKLKTPIRLVHFTAPAKLCEHNDTVRALSAIMNPESRKMLPKLAFSSFTSRFEEPNTAEGFEDIITVDFQFRGSDEQRAVWSRYWVS